MISTYAANKILSAMCGKSQYASLASRAYLALSSTEPQANGQGVTEPSGNGYERKQIGYYNDSYGQLMGTPDSGVITNSTEIHFNEATGSWGTQVYACLYDASTGGNLLAWGTLGETDSETGEWVDKPITPTANTVVVIKEGNFKISIT